MMVEEALEIAVDGTFYLHRVFGEPLGIITDSLPDGEADVPDALVASTAVLINGIMKQLGEQVFPPVIGVDVQIEKKPKKVKQGFGEMFFPSLLFMAMFFMAGGQSEDIWKEKTQGTLRRALTTPHRAAAFLAGKVLAASVLFGVVCLAGVLVGRWVFGLALVNLPLAAAWGALSGAMFYVLLILVQLHAGSQRTGSLLANVITMPLLMIGGSFFPFEMMPDGLANIGRMTPNGWALMQLKAVLSGGFDVQSLAIATGGVVLFGLVLFSLAVRRMAGAFARSSS
jgi:ABC-type Na+ efflux pump permease subunit